MKGSVAEKLLPQQSGFAEWLRRWRAGRFAFCVAALLVLLTGVCAAQKTIHVPADVATIQGGIDAALNGDTVLVSPGTYFENIDFKGKAIVVTSGVTTFAGSSTTIIDGGGKGPVATVNGPGIAVLSGFVIQHGIALPTAVSSGSPNQSAGGVLVSGLSAFIGDNQIVNNQGCGVSVLGLLATIEGNSISGNIAGASRNGCGVAEDGEGIAVVGGADASIIGNVIENNVSTGCGGGIVVQGAINLSIFDNTIRYNSAPCRPGIDWEGISSDNYLVQNLVYGNTTTGASSPKGAGIALVWTSSGYGAVEMTNNTVADNISLGATSLAAAGEQVEIDDSANHASGIYLTNNLFYSGDNQGALNCDSPPNVIAAIDNDVFNAKANYLSNCFPGGLSNGGLSVDPMFVNPTPVPGADPDFHLQAGSPVIGAGDVSVFALPPTDLDGNPRVVNGKVDMGVYESQAPSTGTVPTVSLIPTPNPDYAFQLLTMTATVTSAAGTPTGTVNFLSGTGTPVLLGTRTLSGGVATATTSGLSAGVYSLTAEYLGGENFAPGTSPAVQETVLAEDTDTRLAGAPSPAYIGQMVTFTATVTPKSGAGTPTGTVTFHDGGTLLGPGTLSAGVATFSTASLPAGSNSITAVYGGDANFNASVSAAFTENVAQIGTTVDLISSGSPSYVGQSVTFTATVVPSVSGVVPTGTVTFSDEAGSLGNGTLSGSGVATLPIATLPVGTHTVIAAYGGFNGLAASVSQPVQQVVQPLAFTLAVSPTTLTLKTQNHGIVTVTVTPGPGLTGAVELGCGPLPVLASCRFSSVSVDVSGGSAQTSTLTVDTSQITGYGNLQASGVAEPGLRGFGAPALAALLPAGMLLLLGRRKLRGGALRLVAMLAIAVVAGLAASCSGNLPASTPPGTYTIPVTGQATNGLKQTANLTLVVTQ